MYNKATTKKKSLTALKHRIHRDLMKSGLERIIRSLVTYNSDLPSWGGSYMSYMVSQKSGGEKHFFGSKPSLCLQLMAAVMLGFLATGHAQVDWQWRAPLAAGHNLSSVAYGSGKFVAVGAGWMTSVDGKIWEDKGMLPQNGRFPLSAGMSEIAYGNGYFVAVGAHGRILRSLHGNEWTDLSFDQTFFNTGLASVTFGKGIWLIASDKGEIFISKNDCTTITKVTLPTANGLRFSTVRYGAGTTGSGQFVAVGSVSKTLGDGFDYDFATFYSSNDGENWVSFEEGTPQRSRGIAVVWDGLFNKWLAVVNRSFDFNANFWSSANGVLWTDAGSSFDSGGGPNYPVALSYGEGLVAAVTLQQGFSSTTLHATGWQGINGPAIGAPGSGVHYGYEFADLSYSEDLGRWVAVGTDGQISWCDHPTIWHLGTSQRRLAVDVGRALGDFYAADPASISRSSDGITWTTVLEANTIAIRAKPNPPSPGEPLVTYGTDLFRGIGVSPNELMAVGKEGRILFSSTGTSWAIQDNWFDQENVINKVAATTLNHAVRGPDGRWVVVGTNGFIGSTASTGPGTWVVRESNTIFGLNRIVHTGTAYVAVGDSGAIVTSTNGTAWVPRSAPIPNNLSFTALAVSGSISNPVLVAAGGGSLFTSHDHGATWVLRPLPLTKLGNTEFPTINAVIWTGSEFVGTGPGGVVLVSPDGINWAARKQGATFENRSRAMAFDGSVFVMAGGGLLTSPLRTAGPVHTLNITATGGTVTRFPNLPSYETGTVVRLTAQPNTGYRFSDWAGDVPFDLRTSIDIVVNGPMNITANFSFVPNFANLIRPGSNIQNFATSGSWPWTVVEASGPTGAMGSVGRSGLPTTSVNTSDIGAFVIGSGTLSFQWKVATRGELSFFLNDVRHSRIIGDTGWQKVTVTLGEGFNLLSWRFFPSTSGTSTDRGFLTDIAFVPSLNFATWALDLPEGKRGELDRNGPQDLQNRLAYALGLNPLTATAAQMPRHFGDGPNNTWLVRYTRRMFPQAVALKLEYGATPTSMVPAGAEVTQRLVSTVDEVETWEATLPKDPSGKGFFRMVATPSP